MRAQILTLVLTIPLLWLGGCASAPPPLAPMAVVSAPAGVPASARKAEIRRQLAPLCPAPASAADLNLAADVLDRLDKIDATLAAGVLALAQRFDRFDLETRICRGLPLPPQPSPPRPAAGVARAWLAYAGAVRRDWRAMRPLEA